MANRVLADIFKNELGSCNLINLQRLMALRELWSVYSKGGRLYLTIYYGSPQFLYGKFVYKPPYKILEPKPTIGAFLSEPSSLFERTRNIRLLKSCWRVLRKKSLNCGLPALEASVISCDSCTERKNGHQS